MPADRGWGAVGRFEGAVATGAVSRLVTGGARWARWSGLGMTWGVGTGVCRSWRCVGMPVRAVEVGKGDR